MTSSASRPDVQNDEMLGTAKNPSHWQEESVSLDAIVAVFVPTLITALVYLAIFSQIRDRYPNMYSSRTYKATVPKRDRTPMTGLGKYAWIQTFVKLDEKFILQHSSLDAYLFIRFLKTIMFICIVGCIIAWPILLPVNATGGGTSTELDRLSFSNITGKNRLYAHATVAWLFLGFIMYTIVRERTYLRELRQAWYLSKPNSELLSSRTVLFLDPPETAVVDDDLASTYGTGARRSWPIRDVSTLESAVNTRNNHVAALEEAEVKYIRRAGQHHRYNSNGRSPTAADPQPRPSHRLFPIFGDKIDAINHFREKATKQVEEVQRLRDNYNASQTPRSGGILAVFVEYSTQALARRAYHDMSHDRVLPREPKYIGIQPKEVLWPNLTQGRAERLSKKTIASMLVIAIVFLWTIPIGIIGTLSNVSYLADHVRWLHWLNRLPPSVLGILTGFVPPFLVSWVVSYVPKIYRKIARRFEPTTSSAELLAQTWYFIFQVIQVFLVTTVASGATAVAGKIAKNPQSVPDILAQNLPKASNFYLTYFILQGTASAAQNVLNYSDLFEFLAYDYIASTPRAKFDNYMYMKGIGWCSVFPKFALFGVIATVYSCIAPLTLGFAAAGVYLYYLSYRYNLLFVIQPKVDTKGEAYATALQHLLVGVYLSELCLIGLFSARKAAGPTIMMVILLVATILYHLGVNRLLRPVERYLPSRLQPEDEEAPLIEGDGTDQDEEDHPTIFARLRRRSPGWLPDWLLRSLERFLIPDGEARQVMREEFEEILADIPRASQEQNNKAYITPALTSQAPKLWLVRDSFGLSKQEIEANEKVNLAATDEGAELDDKHHIVLDARDGYGRVPVFKEAVKY